MTTATAETQITADRYRWTDLGRLHQSRTTIERVGEEFYALPPRAPESTERVRREFRIVVRVEEGRTNVGNRPDISVNDMIAAGFTNPAVNWRVVFVPANQIEPVTPLPFTHQLSERGRRHVSARRRDVLEGGFYVARNMNGRVTIVWPEDRGSDGARHPTEEGPNWRAVADLGLDPAHVFIYRAYSNYVEPIPEPVVGDQATYPDEGLTHLPLWRVTGSTDSFTPAMRDIHSDHLFRGVILDSHGLSLIIPVTAATRENDLGFFYELGTTSRDRAGLTAATASSYRKYTIRVGNFEEVQPGDVAPTVEVTAVAVKKMSKKELRAALEAEQAAHRDDMQKVSARLEQEAISRDWCATYDSVVRDLSGSLAVPLVPRRPKVRKAVAFNITTPRSEVMQVHEDATPEEVHALAQAWATRNVHREAVVDAVQVR